MIYYFHLARRQSGTEKAAAAVNKTQKSATNTPVAPVAGSIQSMAFDISSTILGELMQTLMSRMLGAGVSPQDIVRRITQEQALRGSKFSEFKEVMIGMVESHSFELSMYETVVKLHTHDLFTLQRSRMKQRVSILFDFP
jgi:hypothetical protein